jgi:hypothetical protein
MNSLVKTTLLDFENKIDKIKHSFCQICYSVSTFLTIKTLLNGQTVCKDCFNLNKHLDKNNYLCLPIWIGENNSIQYTIPGVLQILTDGEKLLIQQVNVYVPLVHIKNGQLGIKGHVVAFPQHIEEVCYVLPRLPNNVTVVHVLKTYKEKGGTETISKSFLIRKKEVLNALFWLKKYNIE